MTRVIDGIMSDIVLDSGFLITDKDADILCDWLNSYAEALEKGWVKRGSEGDPKAQKYSKVRSFSRAVDKARNSETDKSGGCCK